MTKTRIEFIVWCLMDEIIHSYLKRTFTAKEKDVIREANLLIDEKARISPTLVRKLERIWRRDYYSKPKTDDQEDHTEIE